MILRWIAPDSQDRKKSAAGGAASMPSGSSANASLRKPGMKPTRPAAGAYLDSSLISHSPYAIAHPSSLRHRMGNAAASSLDEVGESEFNAILEEVCDTVMPRKPPKKRLPATRSAAALEADANKDIPWATMFHKLGEETASNLTHAIAQLQDISLLHPNVAPAIANVTDRLDHARRAALIAQQFSQLRGATHHTSELMSLRQVVSDAITKRARWLHRRKVKARLGLLDAQLRVNPETLNSLIDELINWAGGLAQDIGFAVREPSRDHPHAQLLVIARVTTANISADQWQNVGWYLWHQLARSLGAKAQLQVTQDALSVTMDFAEMPTAADTSPNFAENPLTQPDTDMHSVIAGCRVLLLLGSKDLHDQASHAVNQLGLQISACASISQARVLLGLASSGVVPSHLPSAWPQAIVFDGNLDTLEMLALRQQIQGDSTSAKMAFVEISDHVGSDYHISHIGDSSTAHVSSKAIHQSLAPALVFELCKVI